VSYFLERLTRDMEEGAYRYFDAIDRMGGMVAAVEEGFPQREIAEASYRFQQAVERSEKVIVGVNAYVDDGAAAIPILYIDESAADSQLRRLDEVRGRRDRARVDRALEALRTAARGTENTMYPLLECVRAYATVGEMCDALRDVWGEYEEVPSI
jgi:methylmalonyl-CoA mutase N-terminal domain/subunit